MARFRSTSSWACWRDWAAEMRDQGSLLKRAAMKLLSGKLAAAFTSWFEYVTEKKEQEMLLRRQGLGDWEKRPGPGKEDIIDSAEE